MGIKWMSDEINRRLDSISADKIKKNALNKLDKIIDKLNAVRSDGRRVERGIGRRILIAQREVLEEVLGIKKK